MLRRTHDHLHYHTPRRGHTLPGEETGKGGAMQTRSGNGPTSVRRSGASEAARRYTAAVIGVLAAVYAVTFLLGALLHLGVRIPAGATVLAEPRIFPASIVEGLWGLFLTIGAYAAITGRTWAWPALVTDHGFALGACCSGWRRLPWGPARARSSTRCTTA